MNARRRAVPMILLVLAASGCERADSAQGAAAPTATVVATEGAPAAPADLVLPVTYRDLRSANLFRDPATPGGQGHPDFNPVTAPQYGWQPEVVAAQIGADGKPVYYNPTRRWTESTHGKAMFDLWFHDDVDPATFAPIAPPRVLKHTLTFTYVRNGDGSDGYRYVSNAFFPIDGEGYGNENSDASGKLHNYNFTLELHARCRFAPGDIIQTSSDDDLWFFVNGQLVIDQGGMHGPFNTTVTMDAQKQQQLGMTPGQVVRCDLFKADRGPQGSSISVYTTGELLPLNAAPALALAATGADEGDTARLEVKVSDADSDDVHVVGVDWGDGSVDTLTAPSRDFTLSHVYEDNGDYQVSAGVKDRAGDTGAASARVAVANVPPSSEPLADAVLHSGDTMAVDEPFTDPGRRDAPFSYAIDWNDGSPAATGTVSTWAALMKVVGSHRYVNTGSYTFALAVADKDGGKGEARGTVNVQPLDVALVALPNKIPVKVNKNAKDDDDDEKGEGVVLVTVFGSAAVDVAAIDSTTVRLGSTDAGHTGIAVRRNGSWMMRRMDVNRDRHPDLLMFFRRGALVANGDLTAATTQLVLRAALREPDGRQLRGATQVRVLSGK